MSRPTSPAEISDAINELLRLEGWQMSTADKLAVISTLLTVRPQRCVEVGTADGGSTAALSRLANEVITVDIDPTCEERLGGRFDNVRFVTGDSRVQLPWLLDEFDGEAGLDVQLVLIDGDHSAAGVRHDIEAVLTRRPATSLVVLLHDSFNPTCRSGISAAGWASSPWVTHVDLDFVAGEVNSVGQWSGVARAWMSPERRTGPLTVERSSQPLFDLVKDASSGTRWRWRRGRS